MNKKYWERVAATFAEEIFNTIQSDRNRTITRTIESFRGKNKTCCDFGCGIGAYLPLLSSNFKQVYALDISKKCVSKAKANCRGFRNITYAAANLYTDDPQLPPIHLALCTNVLIMSSFKQRLAILEKINRYLVPGGTLILLVPSLESALYVNYRLFELNLAAGLSQREAQREGLKTANRRGSTGDGIICIDNILTKHYIREELALFCQRAGFRVSSIKKIEYDWDTEFEYPPASMKNPYPWDWLAVGKK